MSVSEKDYIELSRMFKKSELHEIASELELVISLGTKAVGIVAAICGDIEENGVPEYDDASDLMCEFLESAEYTDEDGNLIADGQKEEPEEVISEKETSIEKMPPCFAFADDRDPACGKCSVFTECMNVRISTRPECFGLLPDERNEDCRACLELSLCLIQFQKTKKEG